MREVKINQNLKLREDGKLFNIETGEEFIPCIASNGYYQVVYNGKRQSLHRIIAELFIPNPENKPCVDHKNRDKLDNRVENLEWVTYSENNYNTSRNKPTGERICDIGEKEFNRRRSREWNKNNKERKREQLREWRKKNKKS